MKKKTNEKHTLGYIANYFKDQSCDLLEKEYKNNRTKMEYKCKCGGISEITFNNFKLGKRCKLCGSKRLRENFQITYKEVKDFFNDMNCVLLEKSYKNNRSPLKYKCECGNISKISFSNFKKGQKCKKCASQKISGENHFNYNPNLTDEEREENKTRHSDPIYIKWRKTIFTKNNYICQKCNQKGGQLNAHHIKSWASNKSLRLAKSNGITFCEDCHKKFHKKYGKINNNKQQLDEYLNLLAV